MDPLTLIGAITVGGVLIGGGVHFVPVGGAPAAIATATGVGTGTAMLAAGAGLTGLITAACNDRTISIINNGCRCSWFYANDWYYHACW